MTAAPTEIVVIGATARALAQSAQRAGFFPRAVDLFGDLDLARTCTTHRLSPNHYPNGFLDATREYAGLPLVYGGGLENYPRLLTRLAQRHPLLGNDAQTVRRSRDLRSLEALLVQPRCCLPRIAWSAEMLPGDGSWLRKPLRSSGGHDVVAWHGREKTAGATSYRHRPQYYFQQYIAGQSLAGAFVANGRKCLLVGATRQLVGTPWTRAAPFAYSGSLGPVDLAPETLQMLRSLGERLTEAFGLYGCFGVDVLLNEQGLWPVDVNPRYTASMEILERGLEFSIFARHVEACWNRQLSPAPNWAPPLRHGKAVLYARGRVRVTRALCDELERRGQLEAPWPSLADIPCPGTVIESGQPVCTAFAAAPDLASCEKALAAVMADLEVLLYDGAAP